MNRFLEVLAVILVNTAALFLWNGCRFGIADTAVWADIYVKIVLFLVDIVLVLDVAIVIFYLVLLGKRVRNLLSGNIFK